MARLTAEERGDLRSSSFVFPKSRSYPINDRSHARAALSMVAAHGTPSEQARVRAAVKKKYPGIQQRGLGEALRGGRRRGD